MIYRPGIYRPYGLPVNNLPTGDLLT